MRIKSNKIAKQNAPEDAEMGKPLAQPSPGRKLGPELKRKLKQDPRHFARWWSEYQQKMRLRHDSKRLKLLPEG